MADKVDWVGQSGQTYSSYLRKIGASYKDLPGVYIFVKLEIEKWSPIYVGETDSLKDRLTTNRENHHRYYCVTNHGATHICTMVVEGGLRGLQCQTKRRMRIADDRQILEKIFRTTNPGNNYAEDIALSPSDD